MIYKNRYKIILSIVITLLPIVFGSVMWNRLPLNMATSFGINGEITGYSSKLFAVLGLPIILAVVNLISIIATNADPRKKNIDNKMLSVVISIVPACSLICAFCIYSNALGYKADIENIMIVFVGVIFLVIGFFLPGCKQNYTVGIKLPWTLHDEENWNKTHKLAGKIWIAGSIVMIIAGLFKFTVLFMICIVLIIIIPTLYSYLMYRKNKRCKKGKNDMLNNHWNGKLWYAYGTSMTSIQQGEYVPVVEKLSGLRVVNYGIPGGCLTPDGEWIYPMHKRKEVED